ncbi:MAG: polysaccharide deacetylase family protein [Candidatus Eisenbacteria bacterium]
MTTEAPSPDVALTFDLHYDDLPDDIVHAAEWFRECGRTATFFVPTAMVVERRYTSALRRLPDLGHEVASHGHFHDWPEMDGLMSGDAARLTFLEESLQRHADFFGARPLSFRSPCWCVLAPGSIHELRRLGYVADSSATPQRLPLLGSRPFHPGWWSSRRGVHEIAPGLIEVPTSTLLVPAGAPTFLTLRAAGTGVLLSLLDWEARWLGTGPLVLQFHVEDFAPGTQRDRSPGRPSWRDLLLRPRGGMRLKLYLRDSSSERIARLHRRIVERFEGWGDATISSVALARLGRSCTRGSVDHQLEPG